MSIDEILDQATPPEKTVPICLAGHMQAEFEELERDLAIARDKPAEGTLAGGANPLATQIAQQIVELRERMREHTKVFRFRGLSRRAFSDLIAKYPPSKEDEAEGKDVDWETFGVALIAACAVDPAMTEEKAGKLVDVLTSAQYDSLFAAAFSVNKRDVDVPFSYAASAVLQSSKKSSR